MKSSKTVNVLFPLNYLAVYLGGKWVLYLLNYSISWGQYTLAALAALLVFIVASVKFTITWN